jgi:hypothetical protein
MLSKLFRENLPKIGEILLKNKKRFFVELCKNPVELSSIIPNKKAKGPWR